MENVGSEANKVHGSLHGPGYSGATPLTAIYTAGIRSPTSSLFAVEWEPTTIRFYVDGSLYLTETRQSSHGQALVFDHPSSSLLNVAWRQLSRQSGPLPACIRKPCRSAKTWNSSANGVLAV